MAANHGGRALQPRRYKTTRIGVKRMKNNGERERLLLDISDKQKSITHAELREEVRGWESRYCRAPPGLAGRLPEFYALTRRLAEQLRARLLKAREQPYWLEGIVQRLYAQGDLPDREALRRESEADETP